MRIEISGIAKRYKRGGRTIDALCGIDLAVTDRELLVLLGPSGCGKTTLLNLIAGLERPTRGAIRFGKRTVVSTEGRIFLSPRERSLAMVFQSYALYPHLSVFENIAFPLRVAGQKGARLRQAVHQAAATMEIEDLLEARPGQLSGGQRQRVAIARAIVREPELLLLDEPLSNLDAQLRITMRVELKRLQRRLGITAIYVTHDQIEALTLGDRIAVLRDGRIEQTGTARSLYEEPANSFVAGFLGSPSMNIVTVPWKEVGERIEVELAGARLSIASSRVRGGALRPPTCRLGLRPESLRLSRQGNLEGVVDAVEPMGRELLVHVRLSGHLLRVLHSGEAPVLGRPVRLAIDPDRAHLFPRD